MEDLSNTLDYTYSTGNFTAYFLSMWRPAKKFVEEDTKEVKFVDTFDFLTVYFYVERN